ncbi:hypothetical protein FACS1894176_11530 [Bacteroidia bacterium]|nr:hypothetical protein FACS1894176_11530 [Bacteroidia bacterium]
MKKEIIQKIKVWNPNLDIDHIKAGDTIYWDNEEIKNTIYQRKK